MVGLGFLPGTSSDRSEANGVSADGSVIVGEARNSNGNAEAFMWTSGSNMVGLGFLPGASVSLFSEANGVSADGSLIVGRARNSNGDLEAFMLTIPGIPVGGTIVPINTTALLLAGAQTFSWMIPVILSGIGIGLFVVSRKSE